ncbi:MAG: DUF58 domain-containing protein, partial [Sciscionella sp.]
HLHASGHELRLMTVDGTVLADDERGGSRIGVRDDTILDRLATLRGIHQRDISVNADPGAGNELIAILGSLSAATAGQLVRTRPHGGGSLAVLLDVSSWRGVGSDTTASALAVLRAAGWSVAVAGADSAVATIWHRLISTTSPAAPARSGVW